MKAFLTGLSLFLLPTVLVADPVDYATQIKPLLTKHCVGCHGPDKTRSSLRLDSYRGIRLGGKLGSAIVPGKGAESILIHAVTGAKDLAKMPPKSRDPLSSKQVALLRTWIEEGAKGPDDEAIVKSKGADHWSYQPIVRPTSPRVKNSAWLRNAIDAFILARLKKDDIAPSPEADRATLIRRLSLDLLGLPPTPNEVEAFVNDDSPNAYALLVDRLLASPHYGERWGRHWLDAARYADSNGYSIDSARSIWPYRDWVIDAVNADMPFDRFTIEQLAGDLLPKATLSQKVATGFHRNTQYNQEGGIDKEQFRVEAIVDRVNTTGTVWLGLTVGCCQCHDHKFDALSQREYYQFFSFFNSVDEPTVEIATPEQIQKRKTLKPRLTRLQKELKQLEQIDDARVIKWERTLSPKQRSLLSPEVQHILTIASNGRLPEQQAEVNRTFRVIDQVRHLIGGMGSPYNAAVQLHALKRRDTLAAQIESIEREIPVIHSSMVVRERAKPRQTYIHLGGDFIRKGAKVVSETPSVLPSLEAKSPNRLDLAKWLVDRKNPLTARVMMNRVWQRYFGLGIVETENDFGTQGLPPSHPKLLDWLADEFIAKGWSLKAMHKTIVMSATYRQASHARPDLALVDPRNRLLARQNRIRLEAEVVRDVALATASLLSHKVGGPSVFPPQPNGVYRFTQVPRTWKTSPGQDRYRRGMYTHFWRSAPHPGLMVFDGPDASATCTRRSRSNTPLQALTLLNDEAFHECATQLAKQIVTGDADGSASDSQRLRKAFRTALSRAPTDRELEVLLQLIDNQRATGSGDSARTEQETWTTVARVLLNLDEFITRE